MCVNIVPPSALEEPSPELPSHDFTYVYSRRPRLLPPSPNVLSLASCIGPPPNSSSRYALRDRSTIHPPDHYSFTVAALVEPTTYREAAVHPTSSTPTLRRLLPWSALVHGILSLCHLRWLLLLVSGSTRSRLSPTALLSDTRLILLLVVFSKSSGKQGAERSKVGPERYQTQP